MEIWDMLAHLEGKTLKTLEHNKKFDIIRVENRRVIVTPQISESERIIKRADIEGAFDELRRRGELTRSDIRERHSNFNPAYVAAILAEHPNVSFMTKPIRLRYRVE